VQNRKYLIYFGSQKTRTEIHNGSFGSVSSVPVLGYFGSVPRFRFFLPRPIVRYFPFSNMLSEIYRWTCQNRYLWYVYYNLVACESYRNGEAMLLGLGWIKILCCLSCLLYFFIFWSPLYLLIEVLDLSFWWFLC
jgi:hypothetical protein